MAQAPRFRCLRQVFGILRLLSARRFGVHLKEIIKQTGFSRRTAYRYMNAIRDAGVPIVAERDYNGKGNQKLWKMLNRQEFMAKVGIL